MARPSSTLDEQALDRDMLVREVERRRTFAIISHPDAGNTTLTGDIQELTATAELNKIYVGTVQRITQFGAFIEIMPGVDGLLHISEIATRRIENVRDELKEGQQMPVKVINIDPTGKIRLSRKALLQEEGAPADAASARADTPA